MRFWLVWPTALTVGCTGDDTKTDADPLVLAADGGAREPDAPMARGDKPAGAACASGAECAGGSCLGVSGQPYDGNPRFAGGYCTYNDSFCGAPGLAQPEESCTCDKCCVEGYTCLADPDGRGKHCKKYCTVANPTECGAGDSCVPIEQSSTGSYVSPWGGCVAPGSAGT